MKYQIVTAERPHELEVCVNTYIAEGWKCQGGVSIQHNRGHMGNLTSASSCSQAMTFNKVISDESSSKKK